MLESNMGRSVHWVDEDGACCAAIITRALLGGVGGVISAVDLTVFSPGVVIFHTGAPEDFDHSPGTWHSRESCPA